MVNLITYHRGMLADLDRVDRYREAIMAVVREGDVVVDIGTGTGLLSYFACQAGARRVFAIEAGDIVHVARELARVNGYDDRVEFITAYSTEAVLPELADVMITETLWNFGVGEGMIGFIEDARRRLLKPGARQVPQGVDLFVAPLQADDFHERLVQWPYDRHGLSFAPLRQYASNQVQIPRVDPASFIGDPVHLSSLDLTGELVAETHADATLTIARDGTLHGFAGWFESELAPGVRLGNVPPSPRSSWAQVVFPLPVGVAVREGDEVGLRIDSVANGTTWRWVTEAGGRRFDQTTFFGFPFIPPAREPAGPPERPSRTARGDRIARALELMDGSRTLGDVAAQLRSDFPDWDGDEESPEALTRALAQRYAD
jgi:protein arginine N-methyltransferase 1